MAHALLTFTLMPGERQMGTRAVRGGEKRLHVYTAAHVRYSEILFIGSTGTPETNHFSWPVLILSISRRQYYEDQQKQ
jgi:hypothetical protein